MRDWIARDLRYALRGLRRSPGFAVAVVATLGLGIGANAAMFNVVDRLMFRPLSYLRDPGSVHRIYWQAENRGTVRTTTSSYYTLYLDLQRWTRSFSQMAAFSELNLAVGEGEARRERRVGAVSASYFSFFGARPTLGRFFTPGEDVTPRGADVAVLSYAMWQSDFGGRDVRGEPIRIGDIRATIIGVAPRDFNGVNDDIPPVAWVPITTYAASTGTDDAKTYYTRYDWGWVSVMARVAPGVTRAQAESDATLAYRRSYEAARIDDPDAPPVDVTRPRVRVSAIRPGAGPEPALAARTALWVSIVSLIVLVIACANVANLFLARALRRHRETVVRLALGVSRTRLVIQGVMESLILSLLGAVVALLVAQWAGVAIRRLLVDGASSSQRIAGDARTLAVTLALGVLTGVFVGVVSTLATGRGDLAQTLRGGARGGVADRTHVRAALLVTQGMLSVVLLVGAALFVKSLRAVTAMRIGYDADRVLFVRRVLQANAFADSSVQSALRVRLLETAQALPQVEAAAWVSSAPFVSTSNTDLFVAGIDSVGRLGVFNYQATTADYFRAMGTRIVRGRALMPDDRAGAPYVAVVSESMARVLWPGQDALGKCFRMRADTEPCRTVVGIAEDMVQRDLTATQRLHYYVPIEQYPRTWGNGLLVRVRGDPIAQAEPIRQALQQVIPGTSYVTVQPLSEIVGAAQRSWRLGATMFGAFGVLALIVAAIGLYGVIGYNVAQRMHELGVRVALGAQSRHVVWLVVSQSVRFGVVGSALGVAVALIGSRWIEPLLFRQKPTDPVVYAGVSAAMVLVALAASAIPALRAARADPITALRAE